jgi:hypothetical protein
VDDLAGEVQDCRVVEQDEFGVGSSCCSSAVAAKDRSSAVNPDWMAATRSLTGPGRVPISSAVTAKKQPPGKTRRCR